MIEINLFDKNSNHLFKPDDSWEVSQIPSGRYSDKIKYVRFKEQYEGITIIADHYLYENDYYYPKNIKSKYKVGWLLEQREITGAKAAYLDFEKYIDYLDFVMTHDEYLLNKYLVKQINGRTNTLFKNRSFEQMSYQTNFWSNYTLPTVYGLAREMSMFTRLCKFQSCTKN